MPAGEFWHMPPVAPKVTEYRVVTGGDASDLDCEVSALISDGWLPTGGVCVVAMEWAVAPASVHCLYFYQAMVR